MALGYEPKPVTVLLPLSRLNNEQVGLAVNELVITVKEATVFLETLEEDQDEVFTAPQFQGHVLSLELFQLRALLQDIRSNTLKVAKLARLEWWTVAARAKVIQVIVLWRAVVPGPGIAVNHMAVVLRIVATPMVSAIISWSGKIAHSMDACHRVLVSV